MKTDEQIWNKRFLDIAELVSSWSKDPSTKVGAVIVDYNNRIVSLGYNGMPRAVVDDEQPRDIRLLRTIHAEENAILFANRNLAGYSIYVSHFPCAHCAAVIIQSRISNVYYNQRNDDPEYFRRWSDSLEQAVAMLHEAGVRLTGLMP